MPLSRVTFASIVHFSCVHSSDRYTADVSFCFPLGLVAANLEYRRLMVVGMDLDGPIAANYNKFDFRPISFDFKAISFDFMSISKEEW